MVGPGGLKPSTELLWAIDGPRDARSLHDHCSSIVARRLSQKGLDFRCVWSVSVVAPMRASRPYFGSRPAGDAATVGFR